MVKTQKTQATLHSSKARYSCTYENCDKSYSRRSRLRFHIGAQHLKDRPIITCPICQMEFIEQGNLKVHLRTHTGERPYKCKICKKTFTTSGNRADHQRRHLKLKPFECTGCKKKFYRNNALKSHEPMCSYLNGERVIPTNGEQCFDQSLMKFRLVHNSNLQGEMHLPTTIRDRLNPSIQYIKSSWDLIHHPNQSANMFISHPGCVTQSNLGSQSFQIVPNLQIAVPNTLKQQQQYKPIVLQNLKGTPGFEFSTIENITSTLSNNLKQCMIYENQESSSLRNNMKFIMTNQFKDLRSDGYILRQFINIQKNRKEENQELTTQNGIHNTDYNSGKDPQFHFLQQIVEKYTWSEI